MLQRIGNPFAGNERNEHVSADTALHRLIDALHHHREALRVWSAPYEYSQAYTIGGAQITSGGVPYRVTSPFDTWAEYTVSQVAFTGTGPFTACLSSSSSSASLPSASSALTDQAGRDYFPFAANAAATLPLPELWYPLPALQSLFFVVGTGGTALVTVQFRRRVNPAGVPNSGNS